MKILVLLTAFIFSGSVFAQNVGVKDIPASEETTIEISKGKKKDRDFEIVTEESDIEGDGSPLIKDARLSWKAACKEWKDELKDLNKSNSVVSLNCGKMKCDTIQMETICRSKAAAKIRVPMTK